MNIVFTSCFRLFVFVLMCKFESMSMQWDGNLKHGRRKHRYYP